MNVLEKILEEIEHEAMTNEEIGRKQCEGMARAMNIIRSHMERFNRNKGCMVYEVNSNTTEDVKPVSREYINECAEVARKYKKNTEDNNKCSDCSRRKWYQIGYRDGKNEMKNDDWTPVEERLPNRNGVYNVTRLIGGGFISDSAYFDGQDTWYNDNRVNHARPYLTDIVAWQPLPTQYTPPIISKQAQDLRDREEFFTE